MIVYFTAAKLLQANTCCREILYYLLHYYGLVCIVTLTRMQVKLSNESCKAVLQRHHDILHFYWTMYAFSLTVSHQCFPWNVCGHVSLSLSSLPLPTSLSSSSGREVGVGKGNGCEVVVSGGGDVVHLQIFAITCPGSHTIGIVSEEHGGRERGVHVELVVLVQLSLVNIMLHKCAAPGSRCSITLISFCLATLVSQTCADKERIIECVR